MENENDIKENPGIHQNKQDNNNVISENNDNNLINQQKIISENNEIENNDKIINDNSQNLAVNKMDIEEPIDNNIEEQNTLNENNNNELNDTKKEKNSLIRFPLAKIKNIMKLDTDIKLCQKDAYIVIGKLTELFLQDLAQGAYNICKSCKRKTINLEDINSAIKMNPKMGFINFNSIFYVEELNKVKKRPTSSKNIEKQIDNNNNEENNENENKVKNSNEKEKKKRGRSSNIKNKKTANNMTLDSMFENKS